MFWESESWKLNNSGKHAGAKKVKVNIQNKGFQVWKIRENKPECEKGGRSATHKEEKTMSSGRKLEKVEKEHCPIWSSNTRASTDADTNTHTNTMSSGQKQEEVWKANCTIRSSNTLSKTGWDRTLFHYKLFAKAFVFNVSTNCWFHVCPIIL